MNIERFKSAAIVAVFAAMVLTGCADRPEAMLQSAKEHLGRGERAAALIQLRNALQKQPDLAEARFLLGKTLLETNDVVAAEKELILARDLRYSPDDLAPVLAELLVRRGEYKRAIDEFGTTTMTTPLAKAQLNTSLGRAHQALGNDALAKDKFETALVQVPDFPRALIGQARSAVAAGDPAAALALIDKAVTKDPTLAEGWKLKGDIVSLQGKENDALTAYQKAAEADPYDGISQTASVVLLLRQNKVDEAAKQLASMQKVAPNHPQAMYLQALIAFQKQSYVAARDAIQQNLKALPDNPAALYLSARVNYQLQAYTQVDNELRKLLKQMPNHRGARRLLIQTYIRTGQPVKALDTIAPLLAEKDLDPESLNLIGKVYALNGDMVKATKFLERSAALDPTSASKRTSAALANAVKGDPAQALHQLEDTATADPGSRADVALVMLHIQQRKFDAALAAVAALEKKRPDDPTADNLRGTVLLLKGDTPGARKSFERALVKDATNFIAANSLGRLDVAEKKPGEAVKRFEALVAKDPKNVQALLAIAGLRAQMGAGVDEVAKLIGNAVAADATNPSPRVALISFLIDSKEPKRALVAAQEALVALPERPEVLEAAARAYWAAGDMKQAFATYGKLAQAVPSSPTPFVRMAELQLSARDNASALEYARKALAIKPDLLEAQRLIAILDFESGKAAQALAMARDIQLLRPKESVGYLLEGDIKSRQKAWADATAAYKKGLAQAGTTDLAIRTSLGLYAMGNLAEADKFNASWIKDHPEDPAFRSFLAEVAMLKKEYVGAAEMYKKMLEGKPTTALAAGRSRALFASGATAEALAFDESWLKDHPTDVAYLEYLAGRALLKNDYAESARRFKTIVEIEPDNAMALNNLAWLSGRLKDPKAVEYAEQAMKLAPENPTVLDTLGMLLVDSGETKRGVELLRKAVVLQPNAPAIRLNFARALVADGQKDAARREIDTLEKLGSRFSDQSSVAKLKKEL